MLSPIDLVDVSVAQVNRPGGGEFNSGSDSYSLYERGGKHIRMLAIERLNRPWLVMANQQYPEVARRGNYLIVHNHCFLRVI